MIDYGLVKRDRCACGLVIVIASNASDQLIAATMAYHNGTAEHRYWATYNLADPAGPLSRREALIRGDSRGSDSVPEERNVRLRPSGGGVYVSADGYDFDLERTETGRKP